MSRFQGQTSLLTNTKIARMSIGMIREKIGNSPPLDLSML